MWTPLHLDGTAVATVDELWDALEAAGESVELSVVRGAEERSVAVRFDDGGVAEG